MVLPEFDKKIKDYIFLNKEIPLPGLGYFSVQHINQYLSSNDSIIHPPQQKIRFISSKKGVKKNTKLKTYYIDKEVKKSLEAEIQELVNDVLNFGSGTLKGIGKLTQNDEGELVFVSENLINTQSKYLPIIDSNNLSEVSMSKKPSHHLGNSDNSTKTIINIPTARTDQSTEISYPIKGSGTSRKVNLLWASLGSILAFSLIVFMCNISNNTDEIRVLESNVKVSPAIEVESPTSISIQNINDKSDQKIVIGSFSQKSNAHRLKDTWVGKYDVFVESFEQSYRVIILDKNQNNIIKEIRNEINPDAWILTSD